MTLPQTFFTTPLVFLLLAMQNVVAEDSALAAAADDEAIDEVMVTGARSLASLRAEVVIAEDAVYDLYNDLNEDDGYDIICKKETRIGSQIPYRVCKARLFRTAVSDAAEDIQHGEVLAGPMVNAEKHSKILRDKMSTLASEHPELLAALRARFAIEKRFEQERAKKFD